VHKADIVNHKETIHLWQTTIDWQRDRRIFVFTFWLNLVLLVWESKIWKFGKYIR